jgi:hypothetical protein
MYFSSLKFRVLYTFCSLKVLGLVCLCISILLFTFNPIEGPVLFELHKLCATFSASVCINYRLPIKVYYRICTLRHIRIEIIHLFTYQTPTSSSIRIAHTYIFFHCELSIYIYIAAPFQQQLHVKCTSLS